jgi:mannose-6-phosphate isomerase-like protein (cupin superfamily)
MTTAKSTQGGPAGVAVAESVSTAESYLLPRAEQGWASILLSPRDSPCTAFSVGTHNLPIGGQSPSTSYARGDLISMVLAGQGVAELDGVTTAIEAGSVVVAGRKVEQSIRNSGNTELELLWFSIPCGHEDILRTHGQMRVAGATQRPDVVPPTNSKDWDYYSGSPALEGQAGTRGSAFVVALNDRTSFWQSLPTTGHADVILSPYNYPSNAFALGTQTLEPGAFIPPHAHTRNEELLFIAGGRGVCNLVDGAQSITTGDSLYVSQNCRHELRAAEDSHLSLIWIMSPPGLEQVLAELGRLRQPGDSPPEPFPPPAEVFNILAEAGFAAPEPGG